jgi:hypothetical protein
MSRQIGTTQFNRIPQWGRHIYNAPQQHQRVLAFVTDPVASTSNSSASQQNQYYQHQYQQQQVYFLNNGLPTTAPITTPQAPSFGPRYVQHHHHLNAPNPLYNPEEYESFTNNPHQQYANYQQPYQHQHHISHVTSQPQQAPQKRNLIGARFYRKDNSLNKRNQQQRIRNQPQTRNMNMDMQRIHNVPTGTVNLSQFTGKPLVVEYDEFEGGDRRLGLLMKNLTSKWEIMSIDGKTKQLEEHQFTYQWPQEHLSIEDVKMLQDQCDYMLSSITMQPYQLWSYLISNGLQVVTCSEVTPYLFGSQDSAYSLYASHKYLSQHISYFKPTENQLEFELRDSQEIQDLYQLDGSGRDTLFKERLLIAKIASHALKVSPHSDDSSMYKSIKTNSIQDLRALNPNVKLTENMLTLDETRDAQQLHDMREAALGRYPHLNSETVQKLNRLFQPFGIQVSDNALFDFMHRKLQLFSTPNVHLLRLGYHNYQIPDKIQQLAKQIKLDPSKLPDLDSKIRRDLRHHKVYTIDDYPSTEEVDDGISLEVLDDGSEIVYVHIADATRFIHHGSELDKYAAMRTTSTYLPETKIPMLPRELSVDTLSLSENKENFAMTFSARILPDGSLTDCDIFPSVISPVKRIDYDDVDMILEKVCSTDKRTFDSLQTLMRLANIRWKHRMRYGASNSFTTPKPKIVVDGEKISVSISNEMTRSRRMIQELMIVANQVSANFAHERGITVPYRGTVGGKLLSHTKVDPDIDMYMSEPDLAQAILVEHKNFQAMPAACVSQIPNWHGGVGVSAYTQVTSPIRRYSDLLVHHQLKANLRGEKPPLSWEDIQTLLTKMEPTAKAAANLQKSSEKFWLFKFFENEGERVYKALVMESGQVQQGLVYSFQAYVYLMDIGFKTLIRTESLVDEGSFISVQVANVNPTSELVEFVQLA